MCATYGRETWPDFDRVPPSHSFASCPLFRPAMPRLSRLARDVPGKLWQRQPAGHRKIKPNIQAGTGGANKLAKRSHKEIWVCVYIKRYVGHKKCLQKYFIVHVASQQTVAHPYVSEPHGRANARLHNGRIQREFFAPSSLTGAH